jgi:hypothetical protein
MTGGGKSKISKPDPICQGEKKAPGEENPWGFFGGARA